MLTVLALALAVVAAVRSTWSPCGLSMLSTVTPIAERGRGHRFGVTAAWFVVGSLAGGACLGAVAALLAAGIGATGLSTAGALAVAGALALLGAVIDAGVTGVKPPFFRRQLDDAWLDRYRGWVYGLGFGWQIGVGFSTYIMTTAVPATALLAALTGRPALALVTGLLFGLVRGLAVLGSAPATTTAGLARLHRRFEQLEAPVRRGTAIALAVVGIVALAAVSPVALVIGAGAAAIVTSTAVLVRRSRSRGAAPGDAPVAAGETAVPA
jgi:hypothetical protein